MNVLNEILYLLLCIMYKISVITWANIDHSWVYIGWSQVMCDVHCDSTLDWIFFIFYFRSSFLCLKGGLSYTHNPSVLHID